MLLGIIIGGIIGATAGIFGMGMLSFNAYDKGYKDAKRGL